MVFFRADANGEIGTGHVMRCLTIAKALQKTGEKIAFITADMQSHDLITKNGFQVICLNSEWNNLNTEIEKIRDLLEKEENPVIFIDTYFVTKEYLEMVHAVASTIYMDDLNMFQYRVDCLINYNIFAEDIPYSKWCDDTKLALGCSYAPLRDEFENVSRNISEQVKNVLITSGGTDKYNLTGNLLKELSAKPYFGDYEFYVVVGCFNMNADTLIREWEHIDNVHILYNISNMSHYMKLCDVAITAGGVTTYELCACGIPAIMYSLADNQLQLVQKFSDKGLVYYVGDIRENLEGCIQKIEETLQLLAHQKERRSQMSANMMKCVDGKGSARIVELIKSYLKK